ncbi:hypothetical protein [Xanthomonas phage XAJ2]|uniref:Uncharacterized protein n=1 Tax=Xanthomonas phage XAJ2 TaxID=1775249 RepID=A0A1I9L2I3_9CAUD|nr:hypothetical protein [Xanthomonas phage XAJ2]
MSYAISSKAKIPKRYRPKRPPVPVVNAMAAYAKQYKRVYGIQPTYVYDHKTKFIRVGESGGVSLQRIRQLTAQLQLRAGEES